MDTSKTTVVPAVKKRKKGAGPHRELGRAERAYLEAFEWCRRAVQEEMEAYVTNSDAREAKTRIEELRKELASAVLSHAAEEAARLAALSVSDAQASAWRRLQEVWRQGGEAAAGYTAARTSFIRALAQACGNVPEVLRFEIEWKDEQVQYLLERCQVHPLPGWATKGGAE